MSERDDCAGLEGGAPWPLAGVWRLLGSTATSERAGVCRASPAEYVGKLPLPIR